MAKLGRVMAKFGRYYEPNHLCIICTTKIFVCGVPGMSSHTLTFILVAFPFIGSKERKIKHINRYIDIL